MRTNIDIDDGLMREAMRRSGAATQEGRCGRWPPVARSDVLAGCNSQAAGQGSLGRESESIPSGTRSRIVVRRDMVIVDTTVWIDYLGGETHLGLQVIHP
jgi:hypothetical protein